MVEGTLLVLFLVFGFAQMWANQDEVAVSAARAAGDTARKTDMPWGCSGTLLLVMIAFGLLFIASLGVL